MECDSDRQGAVKYPVCQTATGKQFHDKINELIILPKIENFDDMRVTQRSHELGFLLKLIGEGRLPDQGWLDDLYGNIAVYRRLMGLVDRSHPASTDGSANIIRT